MVLWHCILVLYASEINLLVLVLWHAEELQTKRCFSLCSCPSSMIWSTWYSPQRHLLAGLWRIFWTTLCTGETAPWGRTGGTISGTGSGPSRLTHAARNSTPSHSTSTSSSRPSDPAAYNWKRKMLLGGCDFGNATPKRLFLYFCCILWVLNLVELNVNYSEGVEKLPGIFGCKLGWVLG